MKLFFCVMGMVMIVEGLPYFAFPDRMKQVVRVVASLEDGPLRRFGFLLMAVGLGVVYLSMKAG